ncbi:MAG: hypothetical protein ACKVT2_19075 [Saprospiraceae bacterium]
MKFYLGLMLLLTTTLVALPTNVVQACGDVKVSQGQKKSSTQAEDEHCICLGDKCIDAYTGQECPPDSDGCGHCNCPCGGSTSIGYSSFCKNPFFEMVAPVWLYSDRTANYCYQEPYTSAHLTALFQPPRA